VQVWHVGLLEVEQVPLRYWPEGHEVVQLAQTVCEVPEQVPDRYWFAGQDVVQPEHWRSVVAVHCEIMTWLAPHEVQLRHV